MHWTFKVNLYKTLAWESTNSCYNLPSFKCEPNLRKFLVTLLSSHTQFCQLSWSVGETCSVTSLSLSVIFMCLHLRHYSDNFLGPTCLIIPVLTCGITAAREKPHTLPGIPAQRITGEMHAPSWELLLWHLPGPFPCPWAPELILPAKLCMAVSHVSGMEVLRRSVITLSWHHPLPLVGRWHTLGLCVEVAGFEGQGEHIIYVKAI